MLYSRPVEYALRAMAWIAAHPEHPYRRAKVIAKEENIPSFFLSKILKTLAAAKILISSRGRTGGFALARAPEKITLEEIVEALEGLEDLKRCSVGWAKCSDEKPCSLHSRFKPIRESVLEYLRTTTVASMIQAEETKKKALQQS